jgi:hypothetical protein
VASTNTNKICKFKIIQKTTLVHGADSGPSPSLHQNSLYHHS